MEGSGARKWRQKGTENPDEAANIHPLFSLEPSSVRGRSLSFAYHSEVPGDALVDTLRDFLQPLDLPLLGNALRRHIIHLQRPWDRALVSPVSFPSEKKRNSVEKNEFGRKKHRTEKIRTQPKGPKMLFLVLSTEERVGGLCWERM
jgi:hypothetical protein